MVNPFQLAAERLAETGFYSFLIPWILSAAVLWGLLKKSNMFESSGLNAVISLSASFLVWAYLIGPGAIDVAAAASTFVMQAGILLFVFLFGLIASSMFYPKFTDIMVEGFKSRNFMFIVIAIVFVMFFTSGLYKVLIGEPIEGEPEPSQESRDVNNMVVIIAVLIITIGILVSVTRIKE